MYIINEENHSDIAVVENPYRAVEWLWRNNWLNANTDIWDKEKEDFIPLYEKLGYTSPKALNHVLLVENYFLSMELKEFFNEMENLGIYFSEIDVIE